MFKNNETELERASFLVSETDDKGIITYANDDFCSIAGYSLDELVGQNHNIVRHSDMPREAFRDLWNTIEKNQVWKGFVKNKTKNGGFYWVYATIFPTIKDNGEKSYMSCRTSISEAEKEQYQKVYKINTYN